MHKTLATALLATSLHMAQAADVSVQVYAAHAGGTGAMLGTVRLSETRYGLAIYPQLSGLAPGLHGFHVHEYPSCAAVAQAGKMVPALAAGGHFDPAGAKKHGEPWGDGHLGDLPALFVAADGSAATPVLAPRLKLSDVLGRAILIHAGGDNHSDHPLPLGGGGIRVACGVISGA